MFSVYSLSFPPCLLCLNSPPPFMRLPSGLSLASCSLWSFRPHRSLVLWLLIEVKHTLASPAPSWQRLAAPLDQYPLSQLLVCPFQSLCHIVLRVTSFKMCDPLTPLVKNNLLFFCCYLKSKVKSYSFKFPNSVLLSCHSSYPKNIFCSFLRFLLPQYSWLRV